MLKTFMLSVLPCAALVAVFFSRLAAGQAAPPSGDAAEDANFKPLVEAPLPAGFPTYTPVGVIEVKSYPAYRKAETSGRTSFWQLFQHITSAGIKMTAPVEMTYQEAGPPVGRERAMAFLYGQPDTGNTGRQGSVEVVDVPAATVVSIGMRGARTETDVTRAEQRLREWLAENKQRYEQSGPVRVMGYNSPFVPRDRQFYEVQIPLRDVSAQSS